MHYTRRMPRANNQRPLYQRIAIDIAGGILVIISPITGLLPGPGGIPVFLAGLGLLAINHEWAHRLIELAATSWQQATAKIFQTNPLLSRAIDVLFGLIIVAAITLNIVYDHPVIRIICFGFISFSLLVLFTNQNRFTRIKRRLFSRSRNR